MASGSVKKWFDDRGFGFLLHEDGSGDTFFHIKDWRNSGLKGDPVIGDKISFDIAENGGKSNAINMKRI